MTLIFHLLLFVVYCLHNITIWIMLFLKFWSFLNCFIRHDNYSLQCLPQFLQLPPHCSDFPAFLSCIMLRIANATIISNMIPAIKVPIMISLSDQYTVYFANAFVPILILKVCLPISNMLNGLINVIWFNFNIICYRLQLYL